LFRSLDFIQVPNTDARKLAPLMVTICLDGNADSSWFEV
jgi:hypothetical protein